MAKKLGSTRRTPKKPAAGRRGKGDLAALLIRHLLSTDVRSEASGDPRMISETLGRPYPSVTGSLRELMSAKGKTGRQKDAGKRRGEEPRPKIHRAFIVDAYETEFCHAFRIALRVDGRQVAKMYSKKETSRTTRLRNPGAVERFVEHLIQEASESPLVKDDLIVTDAVILHGAPDRDIELHVLTRNGIYSIGKYVRDVLVQNPCVQSATTATVGWQYAFDGYSGQHANFEGKKRNLKDGGTVKIG